MKLFSVEERQADLRKELDRIVDIIVKEYHPDKIIVFGSLAEDKVHEWSDIDMLVIKDSSERPIDRCLELFRLIKPKVGVDLFVYTPEEYNMLIKEKYSFLLNIVERGKILYEKRN